MLMQQPPQQYKFFGRQYSGPDAFGQQTLPAAPIVNTFQPAYHAYKQVNVNQGRGSFPVSKGPDMRFDGEDGKFDGKRARKTIQRRTVDYSSSVIEMLKGRIWQKSIGRTSALQPDVLYYGKMTLPRMCQENPVNCVSTRFVRTSTNKVRCPIFCSAWTPEGRRLVTGASSGEFTLWNGLTFNFETILQAHESAVRAMEWSNNDMWLLSGDNSGIVKYWQSNMNNVKMFQAHVDPIRGVSFSPTDNKFATCSDDGLVKIWDFYRCYEEKVLRGHGADVKSVDWHPTKGLLVSGSKDSQQPVKLWDPKSGTGLATIHGHKSTVMDLEWNENGNWLLTASRDHLIKVYDIRVMKEIQTFRGHKKEATAVNWHPIHESFFASAGSDGSMFFWMLGCEKDLGCIESAHDGMIWTIKWHPLGHIVCTGSNDHTSKFWTRNRPGDLMKDRHNMNTSMLGAEEDYEYSVPSFTESMVADISDGRVNQSMDSSSLMQRQLSQEQSGIPGLIATSIPGLDPEDTKTAHESSVLRPLGLDPLPEMPQVNMASYRQSGFRLPTKEELESGKLLTTALQLGESQALSAEIEGGSEPILYEADENDEDLDEEIRKEFLQHAILRGKEVATPKNDGKGLLPTPVLGINVSSAGDLSTREPSIPVDNQVSRASTFAAEEWRHDMNKGSYESRPDNDKEGYKDGSNPKPLFENFQELKEKYDQEKGGTPADPRSGGADSSTLEGKHSAAPHERRAPPPGNPPAPNDFYRDNVPDPNNGLVNSGPRFRNMEQADEYAPGSKRPYFDGPHSERGPQNRSGLLPLPTPRFPGDTPFRDLGRNMHDATQLPRGPRLPQQNLGKGFIHPEQIHDDHLSNNQPYFQSNAPRPMRPRLS